MNILMNRWVQIGYTTHPSLLSLVASNVDVFVPPQDVKSLAAIECYYVWEINLQQRQKAFGLLWHLSQLCENDTGPRLEAESYQRLSKLKSYFSYLKRNLKFRLKKVWQCWFWKPTICESRAGCTYSQTSQASSNLWTSHVSFLFGNLVCSTQAILCLKTGQSKGFELFQSSLLQQRRVHVAKSSELVPFVG